MNDRESLADAAKRRGREGSFATEAKRLPATNGDGNADEAEAVEESAGCYGYLRGVRDRAVHLEYRRRRKSWPAPGYAWLVKPVYDPEGVITLHYASGDQVVIRGRNLLAIFHLLLRHRVTWIEEQGQDWQSKGEDGLTVVYEIDYQDAEEEGQGDG